MLQNKRQKISSFISWKEQNIIVIVKMQKENQKIFEIKK